MSEESQEFDAQIRKENYERRMEEEYREYQQICQGCQLLRIDCECEDIEDDFDIEQTCIECGRETQGDGCICGFPLCHMHMEILGGFCTKTSSEEHEQIIEEMENNSNHNPKLKDSEQHNNESGRK